MAVRLLFGLPCHLLAYMDSTRTVISGAGVSGARVLRALLG
jgi:hypothetical protein